MSLNFIYTVSKKANNFAYQRQTNKVSKKSNVTRTNMLACLGIVILFNAQSV